MPEFNDIRKNLNDALSQQEGFKRELFLKQEHLKQVRAKLSSLDRRFDRKNQKDLEAKSLFEEQIASLEGSIENEIAALGKVSAHLNGALADYHFYSDPIKNIGKLDDHNPIMLLPLRIETRFKKVTTANGEMNQLWVRIYPDDVAVDTFEETLSEVEVESAQEYWHNVWQAAGGEALERAAWRSLVSAYGSGRARYIKEKYFPIEEAPTLAENELLLTIGIDHELPAAESLVIKKFWENLWLAGTDIQKRQQAHDYLLANLSGTSAENEIRAKEIIETLKPQNFDDSSRFLEENLKVLVYFIVFPKAEDTPTKEQSWSQAPKTQVLPDRFVITGYNGERHNTENISFQEIGNPIPPILIMGPDPSLSDEEQLQQLEGNLLVNEDLKWMFDFDLAVEKGMGFKINLTTTQSLRGFDRIVVVGVKISSDESKSVASIEKLFQNHERSKKGLSILPQGTPTNNTENDDSGYQYVENADISFDQLKKDKQFTIEDDWLAKKDGQCLAEWLGVNPDVFQKTYNASLTDQSEAKAMNIALFPATIGYMMESLMKDVFSDDDLDQTRFFFNNFVSARGPIPAIKIGRQPYGILPTTKFDSLKWVNPRNFPKAEKIPFLKGMEFFVPKLYSILKKMNIDWQRMVSEVAFVGKETKKPQKLLLDIIGLTPNSIEYYQRYAESDLAVRNRLRLMNVILDWSKIYKEGGLDLLKEFGYDGEITPEILNKIFTESQNILNKPLIDDVPLSEVLEIRNYASILIAGNEEPINYIEWLKNAAETSHNTLRLQKGFFDNKVPSTLLYLMLHHSLDLGYVNTSLLLNLKFKVIDDIQFRASKVDPNLIHIETAKGPTESRWKYLYEANSAITGKDKMLIGDYIPTILNTELASSYLKEQLNALTYLQNTPTARLERVFTEHIDLCTYRLDAWKNALMTYQLAFMRFENSDYTYQDSNLLSSQVSSNRKKGTYLGAYGWLEDIRPENKSFSEVTLKDPHLVESFGNADEPTLLRDSTNGGFIGAPSLDHSVTAAILRNAYMSDESPDVFKINLSSERVRKALSIIEGIRGGQNLSALLGYYFERELRSQNDKLVDIDYYVQLLRHAFPLNLSKINSTKIEILETDEAIAANNVVDGLAIINHIKKTGKNTYPFGKSTLPNSGADNPSDQIKAAINEQVNNITNLNDAIADIAMAESVHQVVLGNYDRAAATMETYSKGNFPPIPDVIQTPRKGINITQRFGLQFESGEPNTFKNPRSKTEPSMAKWLESVLPNSSKVAIRVNVIEDDGTKQELKILQSELNLEALDLLFLLNVDDEKSINVLDDIIENHIFTTKTLRSNTEIKILYTERIVGYVNFFQLAAQISSLRKILLQSRALEPLDVSLPLEAVSAVNDLIFLDQNRLNFAISNFDGSITAIDDFLNELSALTLDVDANREILLTNFEKFCSDLLNVLSGLVLYGLPQSSTGFIYEKKRVIYAALLSKVREFISNWNEQLTAFDSQLIIYDGLAPATSVEDRFLLLYQAENTISSNITTPQLDTPEEFRLVLDGKRALFIQKLDKFNLITQTIYTDLKVLLNAIKDVITSTDFGFEDFKIVDQESAMLNFMPEIENFATALLQDLQQRLVAANKFLQESADLADGKKKVELIQSAAMKFFGDDFKMIPSFTLAEKQASEWHNSYNDSTQLLDHLKTKLEPLDFPMDEWVYSVARVREKVQQWEKLLSLTEALSAKTLELEAVQLPYKPTDSWLAFDYPKNYEIENDKLLYTAHYAAGFVKSDPQCGLLLDEWTEVIPAKTEEVGVSFHYDRPNSEPPQVILLAMPTEFKGQWSWDDLMDVVNATLDQAKQRAVEPEQIDKTEYARFLPATVSSVVTHPIMPSLNYSFVNLVLNFLTPPNDE